MHACVNYTGFRWEGHKLLSGTDTSIFLFISEAHLLYTYY